MVWGYKGKCPDGKHDDVIALTVLLLWQGLDCETIDRGMKSRYSAEVDSKKIQKCLPYYLGEVNGYKPVPALLRVRQMLSGEIP